MGEYGGNKMTKDEENVVCSIMRTMSEAIRSAWNQDAKTTQALMEASLALASTVG